MFRHMCTVKKIHAHAFWSWAQFRAQSFWVHKERKSAHRFLAFGFSRNSSLFSSFKPASCALFCAHDVKTFLKNINIFQLS